MITIWIYRRVKLWKITVTIPVRRRLPRTWAEASGLHAQLFAKCLMVSKHPFDKPFSIPFRFMVLNHWLRLSPDEFYKFSDLQITTLLEAIKDIFEQPPVHFISSLHVKWSNLSLPLPLLENETVEAWDIYERQYEQILNGAVSIGELTPLLQFAAYILRQRGTKLSSPQYHRSLKALRLNIPAQFFAYWWYYCTRQALVKRYKGAFGKGGKFSHAASHGWRGLIHSVAQDGPFGEESILLETEVHHFFDYLEFHSKRMKDIEMNQRKHAS